MNIQAKMDELGKSRTPFFFAINYDLSDGFVLPADNKSTEILYDIAGKTNFQSFENTKKDLEFSRIAPNKEQYKKAFANIRENLWLGNTYLTNLTAQVLVETNFSLEEIFHNAVAKYRIFIKGKFVCFSPETFVRINNGKISTFPMKGTIDAAIPNAEQQILNDAKEAAEHTTIVDLLRNDLSLVAKNVSVARFRYFENVRNREKSLLQVSSEITGDLPANYHENIGSILFKMLPAGSISGAPKRKTLEVIRASEDYERGFYTGIAGIFDGNNLDSCVMIRFIEQTENGFVFKSGGGVTADSDVDSEFNELMDKVDVPIFRDHQIP